MDRRTRDLERRAQGGDPDAEATLLRARVRAGELSEDNLLLAAYLGHEPAARAVRRRPPHREDDARWLVRLADLGDRVLARACLAAARAAWRTVDESDPPVLDQAAQLLLAPAEDVEDALFDGRNAVWLRPDPPDDVVRSRGRRFAVTTAVDAVTWALQPTPHRSVRAEADELFRDDPRKFLGHVRAAGLTLAQARGAIAQELVPLVIGSPPIDLQVATEGVERAFLDVDAAARALRSEVVTGRVPQERLALAAYLGDEAARAALGTRAPRPPGDFVGWLEGLGELDAKALARACLLIVDQSLARTRKKSPDPEADEAISLARRSLDGPLPASDAGRLRVLRAAILDRAAEGGGPLQWAVHASVTGLPPHEPRKVVEAARACKLTPASLKAAIVDDLQAWTPRPALPPADEPLAPLAPTGWQGTATKKQQAFIRAVARKAGLVKPGDLRALVRDVAGKDALAELDALEATRVIDRLHLRYLERLLLALGESPGPVISELEREGEPGARADLVLARIARHEAEATGRGIKLDA